MEHGRVQIWNFSLSVELDNLQVNAANEWDIELNTRGEIPYLMCPLLKKWLLAANENKIDIRKNSKWIMLFEAWNVSILKGGEAR